MLTVINVSYEQTPCVSYDQVAIIENATPTVDGTGGKQIEHIRRVLTRPKYRAMLDEAETKTHRLTKLLPGHSDDLPVSASTAKYAADWIRRLFLDVSSNDIKWLRTNVGASPDGEIVYEWWNGEKKLTVYIVEDQATFIKVWGANIEEQMEDGSASSVDASYRLWCWLTT